MYFIFKGYYNSNYFTIYSAATYNLISKVESLNALGTILQLFESSSLMITKGIITSESRPIVWNLNQNEIEPIWIIKPYN